RGTLTRCARTGTDPKGTAQACTDPASLRRLSYDPTRYPRLLPEAYCLCRGCLTGPRGEEDLSLRSAPVLLPTVVLRRTAGCAGGRSVYAEEYVAVPVGCTCVPAPDHDAPAATGTDRGGKERNQDPGHEEWDRDLRRPFRSGAGQ
ncbi:PREDICTED: interleukin-17D, partial [Myotis brandtii]|uniref:interleukin-17D n=1 Tax=Myotis brandtii TaxID=109478 RepID=UPI0007042ACB